MKNEQSQNAWQQALAAMKVLLQATNTLESDYTGTLEALRRALHSLDEQWFALRILSLLDADYSAALVDELVGISLSHGTALDGRELLARLPRHQLEEIVPPAVWQLLRETGDYDAYRRMAELLSHLGLRKTLRQLTSQALESVDPDIREVGEDFTE